VPRPEIVKGEQPPPRMGDEQLWAEALTDFLSRRFGDMQAQIEALEARIVILETP
jgi:hypothetical protein